MYVTPSHLLERQFSEQLSPHHDHPGHPEEQMLCNSNDIARPTKHFTYMYITITHLLERQFSEQLPSHHDHPGHPEEQDVVPRLQ